MKISNVTRLIYAFLFIVFSVLFLNLGRVSAQAVRYPIADLDNCRDAKECYLYCEIPSNKPACWAYKTYGSGEQVLGVDEQSSLVFPVAELGNCASKEACKEFCSIKENHEACVNFAKTHVMGPYKRHQELLPKAQQELGCPTIASCKAFCQLEANRARCLEFAKKTIPPKVQEEKASLLERAKEVLGCDSIDACRALCKNPENKTKCLQLINTANAQMKVEKKPEMKAGITNEMQKKIDYPTITECRALCEKYPDECPAYKKALEKKSNIYPKPSIFPEKPKSVPPVYEENPETTNVTQ